MVDANPAIKVPSTFYDWMRRVYVNDMTIAIRRLVDWDPQGALSFVRLMAEIEDHPGDYAPEVRTRLPARAEGRRRSRFRTLRATEGENSSTTRYPAPQT